MLYYYCKIYIRKGNKMNHNERIEYGFKLREWLVPTAELKCKDLSTTYNIDASYIFEPVRGGVGLIVASDGSVLFATSSISFDKHLEAFINGKRTNIENK